MTVRGNMASVMGSLSCTWEYGFSDGVFVVCFPVGGLEDFWGVCEVLLERVLKKIIIIFVFLFCIMLQYILF